MYYKSDSLILALSTRKIFLGTGICILKPESQVQSRHSYHVKCIKKSSSLVIKLRQNVPPNIDILNYK